MKAVIERDGWAYCPLHLTKLCRVTELAMAKGVMLWCNRCHGEVELDTDNRK